MARDEDTVETEREGQIYELVHAMYGYTKRLEDLVLDLRREVNAYALKARLSIPYSDLHSDIYETFDDYSAFARYKELYLIGKPVKLKELAEELEMLDDESTRFLNRQNGEIICVEDRILGLAEDGETPESCTNPDDKDELSIAIEITEDEENYIALPDRGDINEYEMMENFAVGYPDKRINDLLCRALRGKGAFRRFKDTIREFSAENEWYTHKGNCYQKYAKEWCVENQVPYEIK